MEANAEDHTVGHGGYPNLLGQVEVDAGIMDGRNLAAGAVAAVQGFQHPISIARQVMDRLPHVLLVGQGAERFAAEMGLARRDLLTGDAHRAWEERLRVAMPEGVRRQLPDLPFAAIESERRSSCRRDNRSYLPTSGTSFTRSWRSRDPSRDSFVFAVAPRLPARPARCLIPLQKERIENEPARRPRRTTAGAVT